MTEEIEDKDLWDNSYDDEDYYLTRLRMKDDEIKELETSINEQEKEKAQMDDQILNLQNMCEDEVKRRCELSSKCGQLEEQLEKANATILSEEERIKAYMEENTGLNRAIIDLIDKEHLKKLRKLIADGRFVEALQMIDNELEEK